MIKPVPLNANEASGRLFKIEQAANHDTHSSEYSEHKTHILGKLYLPPLSSASTEIQAIVSPLLLHLQALHMRDMSSMPPNPCIVTFTNNS
jgi:hypothetical protein